MENKKLNGTETEVTTAEFNRYFNENYPYISHSLSNKQVEKWLNQDVIKRVSLSKKADYFQDYILSQGLEDDVQMMAGGNTQVSEPYSVSLSSTASAPVSAQVFMAGGNVNAIEKKVAEVNELIEMGNKNNVSVTDTSSTWQSPMKYKPFVYKNGILYENYEELDLYLYSKKGEKNWRIVKHKYTKSGDGVDTQKEVLNNVAKMYRKELKYYADYDNYMLRSKGKMMAGGKIKESYLKHLSILWDLSETYHTKYLDLEDYYEKRDAYKLYKEADKQFYDEVEYVAYQYPSINKGDIYDELENYKRNINTADKKMAGGSIDNENKLMVANNNKQLRHHTEELGEALENANHIPAWVVSLVGRATQDISDVTHYLDGTTQYELGGNVDDVEYSKIKHLDNKGSSIKSDIIRLTKYTTNPNAISRKVGVSVERVIQVLKDEGIKYYNGGEIVSGDQFNYEIGGL
jgi:hypothetical protein